MNPSVLLPMSGVRGAKNGLGSSVYTFTPNTLDFEVILKVRSEEKEHGHRHVQKQKSQQK